MLIQPILDFQIYEFSTPFLQTKGKTCAELRARFVCLYKKALHHGRPADSCLGAPLYSAHDLELNLVAINNAELEPVVKRLGVAAPFMKVPHVAAVNELKTFARDCLAKLTPEQKKKFRPQPLRPMMVTEGFRFFAYYSRENERERHLLSAYLYKTGLHFDRHGPYVIVRAEADVEGKTIYADKVLRGATVNLLKSDRQLARWAAVWLFNQSDVKLSKADLQQNADSLNLHVEDFAREPDPEP